MLMFQFFNNMLMLGKCSESDVSKHLYDLIFELNQIAPNVLFAVLPQLEFKLKVMLQCLIGCWLELYRYVIAIDIGFCNFSISPIRHSPHSAYVILRPL